MSNDDSDVNLDELEADEIIAVLDQMLVGEQVFIKVEDLEMIQRLLQSHPEGGKYISLLQDRLNTYYRLKANYEKLLEEAGEVENG